MLVDYEMKVTGLMGWVIDAPVENNLSIVFCGKSANAKDANNQFRGDAEKSAIT